MSISYDTVVDWIVENKDVILTSVKYFLGGFTILYLLFAYFYAWKQWNAHFGGQRVSRRVKDSPSNAQPPVVVSYEDSKGQILAAAETLELADDDNLLDEMLSAANGNDSKNIDCEGEPILLDEHAFARALTNDVQRYNIDFENRITTNYYDVFQTHYSTKEEEKKKKYLPHLSNIMMKTEDIGNHKENPVKRVFTWASIDYTADTFRSKVCNFYSWAGYCCLLDLF